MKDYNYQSIINATTPLSVVLGVYEWGSRIYGTADKDSDLDIVIIVDTMDIINTDVLYSLEDLHNHVLVQEPGVDVHIVSEQKFNEMLNDCKLMALECYFQENPIMKYETTFTLNKANLRRSISAVVSNSWVKAKKKVNQGDIRTGLKSLFHSIRILNYGIQIAETGEINHYLAEMEVYFDILHKYKTGMKIENIQNEYKQYQNERASYFRGLCPLDIE